MSEVLVAELCKVIGKNGLITYNTVQGSGRLEVRPRAKQPTEFDLWFVPAWVAPVDDTVRITDRDVIDRDALGVEP